MRLRALGAMGALLVALTACTNTTGGDGVAPSTSAPTTPKAEATDPQSDTLNCPRGAIIRGSAPFCYARPAGFTDNSASRTYGGGWTYKTLVSAGPYDLVEVLAARLPFDSDTYSDERLRAFAESGRFRQGQYGMTNVTGLTPTVVAKARAFKQTARNPARASVYAYYVFRGTTEVYIQCQERDHVLVARSGCATVRNSIQIVSLE